MKKYEDVLLSAGAPIGISGTTEDVAARTWRCGNDAYLLVVNCTTNAQSVILTLSERTGMPSAVDLGPGPIVDDGKLRFNLAPIDYTMVRLPVTSGPDAKQPVLSACPASEYGCNLDLKPSGDMLGALNLDGSRQG